jgi:undecaprenyl-diphosphatase
MIGLSMFLLGSLLFGVLAYQVTSNPSLVQWDTATAKLLHGYALKIPSSLMEYVLFAFFVGRELIVLLAVTLSIYFLYKHYWREFAMIMLGPVAGGLLWYFLSRYFDRPRPTTQMAIILDIPSFPSGHALSSLVFYALLAYLLVPRMPNRFWKVFTATLLTLVIASVGLSRVILGGHYVTDVLAGYAVGFAWVGLVYTLVEKLFPADVSGSSVTERTFEPLRSPGLFKRIPILGISLILLGGLSFAAIGYSLLHHGALVQADQSVYRTFLAEAKAAPPRLNEVMLFGFFLGKQAILVMVTLLSIYFFHQRSWRELAMLLLSSAGGSFVWDFFVSYFDRPRPTEQLGLLINTIPSFPSGHAMSLIICFGFLAYLLVPRMPSRFWKWTLAIVLTLVILFGGFSRVFHGNHYLTDVLAGYALGLAWAALVYTVIENIFWRRKV